MSQLVYAPQLKDIVEDWLRAHPGHHPSAGIAKDLGVSQTSVMNALRTLRAWGTVDYRTENAKGGRYLWRATCRP